ncbi:MAG TPA: hypothetical protein VGB66_12995 [Longimicrobium sp.]
MQRPALLMLVALAGCATRSAPPPGYEAGKLVRLSVVPSTTTKLAITSFRGTACQTADRMPNAVSESSASTLVIPRSESVGTPVPMPNACPVTARLGSNAKIVTYHRDSANAAPEPPR